MSTMYRANAGFDCTPEDKLDSNCNQLEPKSVLNWVPFMPSRQRTRLIWKDVAYQVAPSKWSLGSAFGAQQGVKNILRTQQGQLSSGTLTAIIGPSGAGKSTLLNCLTGRYRNGLSGDIHVTVPQDFRGSRKVSIALIPQQDDFFVMFTVRESLLFASKVKNKRNIDHETEVNKVLNQLNLDNCSDTRISKCSGGQVKRLSFGVELISKPDILILDEPTTGLDSSTAFQCIQLLRNLTDSGNNAPLILCTIHQPNNKIFNLFHNIYLLSKYGQNLFTGPPQEITAYFEQFNFVCPSICNPSDFAIEVAYGDLGEDAFHAMEVKNKQRTAAQMTFEPNERAVKVSKALTKMRGSKSPFAAHFWHLFLRNWSFVYRDPKQFWLKQAQNFLTMIVLSYTIKTVTGTNDGCWADFLNPPAGVSLQANYVSNVGAITQNTGIIFNYVTYIVTLSIMLYVLAYPLEASIVIKEMSNNWYKAHEYYLAKMFSDLPLMLITNTCACAMFYPLTGQYPVFWRFMAYLTFTCLVSDICSTIGTLVGMIFSNNKMNAAIFGAGSIIPAYMFGGFVSRFEDINPLVKPMGYITGYIRYTFEGMLVAVYGFNRCPDTGVSFSIDQAKGASSDDPLDTVANLFSSPEATSRNSLLFARTLDVNPLCMERVINGSLDYLGLGYDVSESFNETDINGSLDFMNAGSPYREPSFVMNYFSLTDSLLYYNVFILIGFIVSFRVVTYLCLLHKVKISH